jgi:hypothetical protein
MPIANTVEANIVVNFEDRFSGPACKAFEQFRKCAEAALKALDPALITLFIRIETGIDKFVNAIDRFALVVDSFLSGLAQKRKEVVTFGESLDSVGQFFRNFLKDLKSQSIFEVTATVLAIFVGLATLAKLAASFPLVAAAIAAGLFLIFAALDTLKASEKIALEVQLKDEASAKANLLRKSMESTFRDPIVQEIQVLKRNLEGPGGPFSGAGNPGLDDALITLRQIAPFPNPLGLNLEPQFDFPSFASGVRFVPRDMLAKIHKGETVLPRSQAEQFRNGQMRNISVGNITLNMNGGLGANRNEARRFARMIREELQRTDERTTI